MTSNGNGNGNGNDNGNGKDNGNGNDRSRFPSGMTKKLQALRMTGETKQKQQQIPRSARNDKEFSGRPP